MEYCRRGRPRLPLADQGIRGHRGGAGGDVAGLGTPLRAARTGAQHRRLSPLLACRRAAHPGDAGAHGARHRAGPGRRAGAGRVGREHRAATQSGGAHRRPHRGHRGVRRHALRHAARRRLRARSAPRDPRRRATGARRGRRPLGHLGDHRRPRALRQPSHRAPPADARPGLGGRPRPAGAARLSLWRAPHARARLLRPRARRPRMAHRLPWRRHPDRPGARRQRADESRCRRPVRPRPPSPARRRRRDRGALLAPAHDSRGQRGNRGSCIAPGGQLRGGRPRGHGAATRRAPGAGLVDWVPHGETPSPRPPLYGSRAPIRSPAMPRASSPADRGSRRSSRAKSCAAAR
jgi:hypothetical protein